MEFICILMKTTLLAVTQLVPMTNRKNREFVRLEVTWKLSAMYDLWQQPCRSSSVIRRKARRRMQLLIWGKLSGGLNVNLTIERIPMFETKFRSCGEEWGKWIILSNYEFWKLSFRFRSASTKCVEEGSDCLDQVLKWTGNWLYWNTSQIWQPFQER